MQCRDLNPFITAAAAFAVAFLLIAGFLCAPIMIGRDGSWAEAWHHDRGTAPQIATVPADERDQDATP